MRAADALYLASRSLRAAPGRTAALVSALAVILFLPAAVTVAAAHFERSLLARAEASPVLIGPVGSRYDTALAALYFEGQVERTVPRRAVALVHERGYGLAVPLHTAHTAQGAPVVGTAPDYLKARGLEVAEGRGFALIGEVVVGARLAEAFGLAPGHRLRSDPADLTDLTAPSAAALEVVGVLAPAGSADDDAVLTDVKTTWWLDGRYHGHRPVKAGEGDSGSEPVDASRATFLFTEPSELRDTLHLHGDEDALPLTAVLVWPSSRRAHDQLLGDLAAHPALEGIRPPEVVREVLFVVGGLEATAQALIAAVSVAALLLLVLVALLTLRLRQTELSLYGWLGASRGQVAAVLLTEAALTGALAALFAGAGVGIVLLTLPRLL